MTIVNVGLRFIERILAREDQVKDAHMTGEIIGDSHSGRH